MWQAIERHRNLSAAINELSTAELTGGSTVWNFSSGSGSNGRRFARWPTGVNAIR
jgi:hypothetical protein